MQWNLEEYAREPREATVSEEVSLGREDDAYFRQHGRTFSRKFSSGVQCGFEKFMQYVYGFIFFAI